MKKFSNISGFKVTEEPQLKLDTKLNEEDLFKGKVLNLMDQLLSVRTYGPVDRYLRAGNIKIAGKEMFLEALLDLLKDKSSKDEVRILESLKSKIKDWETIDSQIDQIEKELTTNESKNKIISHRNKLKSLYNNYKQDEQMLLNMIDESCGKIINREKAQLRALAAEYMSNEDYPQELFVKISEKYKQRAKELGL